MSSHHGPSRDAPVSAARRTGRAGELVLRERGGAYEIISNGVFLMDTRDGRSERLLVRWALEQTSDAPGRRVLLGGLGVGWSLAEALAAPAVAEVVVVEWEPAVIAFNRAATAARTGGHVDHPRVRCVVEDLVTWLARPGEAGFAAICLDVDNGPDWTVSPGNAWLYGAQGLSALRDRLAPGGVLGVWAAARSPAFEARLARHFATVRRQEVPVPRGVPDVVYLARCAPILAPSA